MNKRSAKPNYGIEKALGVAIDGWRVSGRPLKEELRELGRLCATAGARLERIIIQQRDKPDPSTLVGRGKVEELVELAPEYDLIVFNDSLKPAQHNTLRKKLPVKVIDRTDLILDIFARRAQTNDSKLQVELAQLEHNLPRKRGWGWALTNPGAGIGTRGPGETMMTIKERDMRRKIHQLKTKLENIRKKRNTQRKNRRGIPEVSLVGYTNSGKTTLLNALTNADALKENMLFATLDTKTRRVHLEGDRYFLMTDTVGFIQRMPAKLKEAFKATLEELGRAACFLHVIDISSSRVDERIGVVNSLLKELGFEEKKSFMVFNKIDCVSAGVLERYKNRFSDAHFISAESKEGLTKLKQRIYRYLLDNNLVERPQYAKKIPLEGMIQI
ncbi:MAG: GTPase HflX [bacterium]